MDTPILLSKRDAAEALSVSLRTLDHLINQKLLIVTRIGKRVLVPRKALERLADGQGPPTQSGSIAQLAITPTTMESQHDAMKGARK